MKTHRISIFATGMLALMVAAPPSAWSETRQLTSDELNDLTFEELMNIEVTSASKKTEPLSDAPAAVFVITQDDIRRSGATSIPEALRLAPGVQVARVDANTWAVSVRGFNGTASNKLLVMIDGRSVYTPLYSGVFWDVQTVLLEDVDRIEVVRGPGGTLWGANAVNGVINVITRHGAETTEGLASVGGGNQEHAVGGVRYGASAGENAYFRVFTNFVNYDAFEPGSNSGSSPDDAWWLTQAGARLDWKPSSRDDVTFEGNVYVGEKDMTSSEPLLTPPYSQSFTGRTDLSGGFVRGRWSREFSVESTLRLRAYYDRTGREIPQTLVEDRHTIDALLEHHYTHWKRNDLVWGLGARVTSDELENSFAISWDPDHRTDALYSAFVQDEIALAPERLYFTLGAKVEHNSYTGAEFLPSARLLWKAAPRHTVWTAASRAVRTPTRLDSDSRINAGVFPDSVPTVFTIFGSDDFQSEEMVALEAGYRWEHSSFSADVAVFHNVYDNLASIEPGVPFYETTPAPAHYVLPYYMRNGMEGTTYGAELSIMAQLNAAWRVNLVYAYLEMDLETKPGSANALSTQAEGDSPANQASVRSLVDLPLFLEWDAIVRYVDNLPSRDVPRYFALDMRLAWVRYRSLELAVAGRNLFSDGHSEFGSSDGTEVERSVYASVVCRF